MNDKITFSGSLQYVTYVIEKYEKEGYEVTDYKPVNNPKFGTLFFVTMGKKEKVSGDTITIFIDGKPIGCITTANLNISPEEFSIYLGFLCCVALFAIGFTLADE